MPQRQGLGHLTLTVTGLERSADFYNRLLGSQTAMASEDHSDRSSSAWAGSHGRPAQMGALDEP